MCVKIVTPEEEKHYDMDRPLEEQLEGCKKIIIDYEPKDLSVLKLMRELERFVKSGIDSELVIQVVHNNHLNGAKIKKITQKSISDISINELIKAFVVNHKETDKKLEELANYCISAVK